MNQIFREELRGGKILSDSQSDEELYRRDQDADDVLQRMMEVEEEINSEYIREDTAVAKNGITRKRREPKTARIRT